MLATPCGVRALPQSTQPIAVAGANATDGSTDIHKQYQAWLMLAGLQ